jgi:antirestriction protein ArdC
MLWSEAISKGFSAPIWMTFKQALELAAHVKHKDRRAAMAMPIVAPTRNGRGLWEYWQ